MKRRILPLTGLACLALVATAARADAQPGQSAATTPSSSVSKNDEALPENLVFVEALLGLGTPHGVLGGNLGLRLGRFGVEAGGGGGISGLQASAMARVYLAPEMSLGVGGSIGDYEEFSLFVEPDKYEGMKWLNGEVSFGGDYHRWGRFFVGFSMGDTGDHGLLYIGAALRINVGG
jgi:hypothetical protein